MENKKTKRLRQEITSLVKQYSAEKFAPQPFIRGTTMVPPSGKEIGFEELQMMVDASLDAWLTAGRFNVNFERELASFLGVNHVITVNSGSSANLVAFHTLTSSSLKDRAIKQGDEVRIISADLGWREGIIQLRVDKRTTRIEIQSKG